MRRRRPGSEAAWRPGCGAAAAASVLLNCCTEAKRLCTRAAAQQAQQVSELPRHFCVGPVFQCMRGEFCLSAVMC